LSTDSATPCCRSNAPEADFDDVGKANVSVVGQGALEDKG
jgi:hypothetical protein